MMRILLVNTYDLKGGAAKATTRILDSIQSVGLDAELLVQRKFSERLDVIELPGIFGGRYANNIIRAIDRLPKMLSLAAQDEYWSSGLPLNQIGNFIESYQPDVLHLNWTGDGFVSTKTLEGIEIPIVWTFQDFWAMTGGCHYPHTCEGFKEACGRCPLLGSRFSNDMSRVLLQAKLKVWKKSISYICVPSSWAARMVSDSAIFNSTNVSVIPNPLDTREFFRIDKAYAREELGLDSEKRWLVFGAVHIDDQRKGGDLLLEALMSLLNNYQEDVGVLLFGGGADFIDLIAQMCPVQSLGYLDSTTSLRLAYAAADVAVFPSRYETWGQVIAEALACGTPVVAFDGSGPSDIIVHKDVGYLAKPFDTSDLAAGIRWILQLEAFEYRQMSSRAAERSLEFSLDKVGQAYKHVYKSLTEA